MTCSFKCLRLHLWMMISQTWRKSCQEAQRFVIRWWSYLFLGVYISGLANILGSQAITIHITLWKDKWVRQVWMVPMNCYDTENWKERFGFSSSKLKTENNSGSPKWLPCLPYSFVSYLTIFYFVTDVLLHSKLEFVIHTSHSYPLFIWYDAERRASPREKHRLS